MNLKKIDQIFPPTRVKKLLIFSIILLIIIYPIMGYFFFLSGYPVGFIESQMSFSGQILKEHYKVTNIDAYRVTQTLDYVYMVGYGIAIFSLALIITRKFDENSGWRKSGYFIAIFGICAASCDAIENVFILLMLTDPANFPDIWAILHSSFALVKFILIFICIGWAIIAAIKLRSRKKSS